MVKNNDISSLNFGAYLYSMMTSSNGNIFRVTGPLCWEFTNHKRTHSHRPVTQSFDVFFDLRLNKRLSKQSNPWYFETPSRSWWRHCDASAPNGLSLTIITLRSNSLRNLWLKWLSRIAWVTWQYWPYSNQQKQSETFCMNDTFPYQW